MDEKMACVEALAREIASALQLDSVKFQWGLEDENLQTPLRITTEKGITEPAIRITRAELEWCTDHSSQHYTDLRNKLIKALDAFSPQSSRIGFVYAGGQSP